MDGGLFIHSERRISRCFKDCVNIGYSCIGYLDSDESSSLLYCRSLLILFNRLRLAFELIKGIVCGKVLASTTILTILKWVVLNSILSQV